jgi:prepilin-type N-terminal cleavage/methylation domain-containing protein
MRQRGFSLIELVIVIAIGGILMALATLSFNQMTSKQAVNDEIKMIYAEIAGARSDSMYQRRQRRVVVDGTSFRIYSSLLSAGVDPILTKPLSYPIRSGSGSSVTINFDVGGLLMGGDNASICVDPPSDFGTVVDSIVVFTTRTTYGSWDNSTGDCKRDNITLK